MLFLWFYHAARRNSPRFIMVSDHINYLTFEDPGAVHTVRRALKLAHAGDLYGAAETAGVDVAHAAIVGDALRKGMRFSIGAEVDNDPRARPDAQNIVDAMRPDGIIRSVHFLQIDHPEKGPEFMWPYDNPEFAYLFDQIGVDKAWELYAARLFDDIEKLPGHVIGHFYKPTVFGHWPDEKKLEAYEDQLIELAHARGMAIEINARMIYRASSEEQRAKYVAANKRLMRKAKARGVGIAIGSDAHSPKDQGEGFDAVLTMLDECSINEVVFPVAGRLARVVLRATKEQLEQHAQRSPEPVQAGSSISGFSRAELGLPEEPEGVRAARESRSAARESAGPKKRAASPERTTKKPAADPTPKSTSKRSPESKASSTAAKAAPKEKPVKEKPVKEKPIQEKPVKEKAVKEKAAPKKAAASVKKAAPAKKAAAPVKKVAAKKAAPAKAAPAKKAPAKKAAAKKAVPAKKAPAKKAAAKKAAPAKKAPAKTAKKVAAKPAAKKLAPAKKTAAKTTPKGSAKKKTTKRR
jgi:HisJ family histidinol phosphate phosphatase